MEDFSDAASLPHASIFKFTIISKSFFSKECREKVQKRIDENLVPTSNDKIKMITREDIMTAGKTKGTILDTAGIQALSPEDPRRQLTEEEMFARAAADRLFEMSVLIRRAKKEKIAKMGSDPFKCLEPCGDNLGFSTCTDLFTKVSGESWCGNKCDEEVKLTVAKMWGDDQLKHEGGWCSADDDAAAAKMCTDSPGCDGITTCAQVKQFGECEAFGAMNPLACCSTCETTPLSCFPPKYQEKIAEMKTPFTKKAKK